MRGGMIDMESNTTLVQNYPAHEAIPDGEPPFPPVIVIHGAFGLDEFTRLVATHLAREGFYALAPDFYATPTSYASLAPGYMRRTTGGPIDYDDETNAQMRAQALTDERVEEIFRQACTYATTRWRVRGGAIGVIGYSTGGRVALLGACNHADEVRACVAFAPADISTSTARGRALLGRLDHLQCPVLLFYGGLDMSIPLAERNALKTRLTDLDKDFTLRVFPEAERQFYLPERDGYDISSSRTAWTETVALLRRTLLSRA